jgi:hypothetical protein
MESSPPYSKLLGPIGVAVALTPICLFIAITSGGAGHGTYTWAKVLFPYTMLSWGPELTVPYMILAVAQMPLYGLILGIGWLRGHGGSVVIILTVIHGVAVALCLTQTTWRRYL